MRSHSASRTVTLYTRPGCHLCDQAREAILALRADGLRFELREVDIEGDEALHAAYLERIPVVAIDGTEVTDLRIDVVAHSPLAELAEAGQVAADLGRVDVGVLGELLGGDRLLAHLPSLDQDL